jgi:hypothetical protein
MKYIVLPSNYIVLLSNYMKYIVVFPFGGLCDMLSRINYCFKHAVKYNRQLVIETRNIDWFQHDIRNYISFLHPNIYDGETDEKLIHLETLTIYPKGITKLRGIRVTYRDNHCYFCEGDVSVCGHVSLEMDYPEDVIVYGTCGNDFEYDLLKYIKIKPNVANIYLDRLARIPKNYLAVHIRNTDMQSDVNAFMIQHQDELEKCSTIFLASDNKSTIDYFISLFGEKCFTFSNIQDPGKGKNIHYFSHNVDKTELIIDCIVDLLMLGSGERYLFSCNRSGYSNMAKVLFNNKDILHNITKQDSQ